ncbi:hypothetical protein SAMD00019534_086950 [Acytostelium subglobosum LB1]|uniref:hypothetical protein n=1 Tax=Acytostelium subglobosum LB1 TaxID=1410327 RepID=UPI000644EEC0|nr:hypothetical protein SAMD00019534_086950 [Acytostelium subglobosum LB1]GAM25520.1 hypothetical protein SAMD00019534_086950 [Acytostelium subglobosum LB1]|eukprot:XP_012751506.1 hypothetical protein SAMD00019534_086950 [Acytostelium subglobosum LB1]
MTRVCVKQLPKHLTERRLKEHFERFGVVTDCKIMKAGDGSSRMFGFVGFSTDSAAKQALMLHGSFLDTSKITVEMAVGNEQAARPWSKYSAGSSAYNKLHEADKNKQLQELAKQKKGKGKGDEDDLENDDEYKKFKGLMQPRSTKNLWSNEDNDTLKSDQPATLPKSKRRIEHDYKKNKDLVMFDDDVKGDGAAKGDDDDDLYEDMPSAQKQDKQDSEQGNTIAKDSAVSDLDWFKSKLQKDDGDDNDNEDDEEQEDYEQEEEVEEEDEEDKDEEMKEEEQDEDEEEEEVEEKKVTTFKESKFEFESDYSRPDDQEDVGESGRLFLRNLSFTVTEDDLKKLFEPYGKLSEIYIPIDKDTKKSKGIAFLLYMVPENAVQAMTEMDGKIIQGRLVHILPAKNAPHTVKKANAEDEKNTSSYKKQQERELKAAAGSTYNWNALFMRSDAIISSLAERYKLTQGEILDPNSTDMAVRMTLMETYIINETRKFLEEEGVVIDKIGGKGIERSKTVILVKNIPHKTTTNELEQLFSKFGELARMLLTPARTLALVEFYHVSEAKVAFQNLAYTKFHHVPLYLEWAPNGVFSRPAETMEQKQARREEQLQKEKEEERQRAKEEREREKLMAKAGEVPTIMKADYKPSYVFIKNLHFDTKNDTLKERLKGVKDFVNVNIATKLHPKTGEKLSHGYAFAEFSSKQGAFECIKKWNGATIDGHEITIKLSDKNTLEVGGKDKELPEHAKKKQKTEGDGAPVATVSTKILVKNLAFEATQKDIRQLFGTYGELQSVRLPKKPQGGHRGFCFVEYLTEQEAKNAMDSLKYPHLYGRHLVLEYAEADKNVEQLREKAQTEYNKLKAKK